MWYSGARGTLIYEKNLMSKISSQTPFKMCSDVYLLSHLHHEWKMHFRQFGGQKSLEPPEKPLENDDYEFCPH
jgi:hypothetical protein